MKLQPVDHPVVGRLVPDLWGTSLMCFRQIPKWKMFGLKHSAYAMKGLDQQERKLVEGWKDQPEALVKKSRNRSVFLALRSLGVFEVAFGGVPSNEQVAAYQYFQEHRERICANVADALLRYYRGVRDAGEDWFDPNDCPAVQSVEELAPLATLDGLSYTLYACEGLAVISLGWKVDWDMEHGLGMAVWKDQVVGIGIECIEDLSLPAGPGLLWDRSQMTEAERESLACVSKCIGEQVRSPLR